MSALFQLLEGIFPIVMRHWMSKNTQMLSVKSSHAKKISRDTSVIKLLKIDKLQHIKLVVLGVTNS